MKKPAEAIHITFTVFWRFYQKIIRLSTLEIEWYIDWLLFYNQQIKQSLTSTCRVSKRMEVNSLIGEHICYMHSMHSYILLYMYMLVEVRRLIKPTCITCSTCIWLCAIRQSLHANLERSWFSFLILYRSQNLHFYLQTLCYQYYRS